MNEDPSMKKMLRLLCTLVLLSAPFVCCAQNPPVITSIDPPDWYVQLPSPMLLVHGTGLDHAAFTLQARGVRIDHTQSSANGHWAFLWLDTASASPQTVRISATSPQGKATREYQLRPRTEPAEAHRGFSPADVIYLVMTDRFADGNPANNKPPSDPGGYDLAAPRGWHGGDFAGIEQHLDYLTSLGVTALWTTPVYDNGAMPESYHGYAATDLYNTDPHFGTLDDYRHLSAALHRRGLKLIIDLVPNHIGVQHVWIADPPAPDWFHGTLASHTHSTGDFNTLVDPHATPASSRDLTHGWFVDSMPDMNQENPLVSQYLIQNALWWVETAQIDAIRIDTFPYVGRAFWHDFHAALHKSYPNLTTVGEVFNPDPIVTSFFAGGRTHSGPDGAIDTGLDTPFDFPTYFAVRDVLAHNTPPHSMTELASVLRQDGLYPYPENLIQFFGNHDTSRFLTEAGGLLPRLREALGLMATMRGAAELYSGDEIAMPGGGDPDNRRDFPGGFPADHQPSAFDPATRTPDQQATFAWTSGLLADRKNHAALQGAPQQDLFADDTAFVFLRTPSLSGCSSSSTEDAVLVAVNKSPAPRTLNLPTRNTALSGCTRFQPLAPAATGTAAVTGDALQLTIPADAFVLFTVR
jgi:glycosidase